MSIVVLAILAAAVFFVRLALRQVTRAEWGVAAFFILHFLLIQLQMYLSDYGKTTIDFRYHAPTYSLLFGWVAIGLVALIHRVPLRWRCHTRIAVALAMVWLGVRMIANLVDDPQREVNEEISRWAADVIRRDWQGPRIDKHRLYDVYFPNKRPAVAGLSGLAAYYVGGRQAVHNLTLDPSKVRLSEKPDYIVATRKFIDFKIMKGVMSLCDTPEYECIATKDGEWDEYRLYKRVSMPKREL